MSLVKVESSEGITTITMARADKRNALDGDLIAGLLSAVDELAEGPALRAVLLKGNGKHFQAGADLKWINGVRPKSPDENEAVSRATFEAVQRLNTLPIPTVALVQGGCFGGGTGVISACDVVIAADNALFSITEVRWGLTAAIIICLNGKLLWDVAGTTHATCGTMVWDGDIVVALVGDDEVLGAGWRERVGLPRGGPAAVITAALDMALARRAAVVFRNVHVAEDVITLDLVSKGRVILGVGIGSRPGTSDTRKCFSIMPRSSGPSAMAKPPGC